jgi:glucose/arabinose dehydrogenase
MQINSLLASLNFTNTRNSGVGSALSSDLRPRGEEHPMNTRRPFLCDLPAARRLGTADALPRARSASAAGVLTLALLGLAGCGQEQTNPPADSPPSSAPAEKPTTALAATATLTGVYKITNACSGSALSVTDASTDDRARMRIFAWADAAHQKWSIEAQSDGTYRLVAQHSGKVLDASSMVREDGTPVFHQFGWHGRANQRFAIEPLDDGNHRLIVQHNQTALDVRGAGTADGTTVWQWAWNATCAQRWKLERLDGDAFTPVATAVHAGNNQQAVVGSAVAVPPAIKVSDREGRGVAGAQVSFVVVSGGGSVINAQQVTNVQGIATVGAWTLGPSPGENILSARTAGLPEVTFRASATAQVGTGTLTRAANTDNQSASAGTAVPVAPAVVVLDPAGQPKPGVTVSFAAANGGSVQNTTAVSDASGMASVGRWTLGPGAGSQTLQATAADFTPVTFNATAFASGAPNLTRSVFMGGLSVPWDMAFAPDGTAFYTERGRGLSVRLADGTVRQIFRPSDFVAQDQSGMLGVALDPAFASNRRVYVFMASNSGGATDNRIVRFAVNAEYTAVSGRTDIVTGIAYAGGAHSGGRIRFGPDGLLYITTGDNRVGAVPQNLASLGGKVLRVDRDGNPAAGNNPPAGANPRIYTYGHRNPQGIAFRPGSGLAFTSEHGPNFQDEVTPLRAGGNGGWDPRCATGGGYCGYDNITQMTDLSKFPDAMRPAWSTGSSVGSSRGMAGSGFVSGAQWRDWNGALIVALLSGRRLEVLQLNAEGTASVRNTPLFDTLNERLRFVVQGPDGALYVGTDGKSGGDEIWRVMPN